MNVKEYTDEINTRYTPYPPLRAPAFAENVEVLEACLGLSGEVGEVLDLIKKHLTYNIPLDEKKFILEMGDVFHYYIRLANKYNVTLEMIMEANCAKLRARFPTGYTNAAAVNKADQKGE